ncbi:LysR family transcriptional regulator [Actinomadura alba]|uniref:LysR family transcriptional regulator n=1 Tax=Actinomadura alba TaxID=406431 RepID=A0ABR7M244_9ACTN|nr:LysR family transcriptional regulator [Actinomadura alba]MBC6471144.1 LysR family transcriptional regulator [Actinomadura alba]
MELDLGAVRAFVAVADDRHFGEAAVQLGVTQQAVSKRIAKLESDLGTTLFHRSRGGAELTGDGRSFLTHARALISLADQAVELQRSRRRSFRVDVLDTRLASIELVRTFHGTVDDVDIDIVTSAGLTTARTALARGSIDAFFGRVTGVLDDAIESTPAYLEPLHVLISRRHALAGRQRITMSELSGTTAWMPGNAPGTEWAEFYRLLSADFAVHIDTTGPDFGWEHFVERISGSDELFSLVGEKCRLPWHADTVQIPITDPTPVYPCSLLWNSQNRHPMLPLFIRHVESDYRPFDPRREWLPAADHAFFVAERTART